MHPFETLPGPLPEIAPVSTVYQLMGQPEQVLAIRVTEDLAALEAFLGGPCAWDGGAVVCQTAQGPRRVHLGDVLVQAGTPQIFAYPPRLFALCYGPPVPEPTTPLLPRMRGL